MSAATGGSTRRCAAGTPCSHPLACLRPAPAFQQHTLPPCKRPRSWDVIEAFALHYDLHPLSVEDCVHVPQRIKVRRHKSPQQEQGGGDMGG